jgi:rhodanese-related sulfurtransferase
MLPRRVARAAAPVLLACLPLVARRSRRRRRPVAEIDVPAATRSLAQEQARLVQVLDVESHDPRVEHAAIVRPDEPVPDAWLHEARPIVVIAHDEVAARRLAARLLRLGASRVSVVRGGIEAWSGPHKPAAFRTRKWLQRTRR